MGNRVGELHIGIEQQDLMWLAGLLEGEGYFGGRGKARPSPVITLSMTDKDVVEKAARLMGGYQVRTLTHANPRHKDTFIVSCSGPTARSVMRQLLPFMGKRRKNRISDLLVEWEKRP